MVLMALLMVPLIGVMALGTDLGYVALQRTEFQVAADAAAMAAAVELRLDKKASQQSKSVTAAKTFAAHHVCGGGPVTLASGDISFGNWNATTATFTAGGTPLNSVRVIAHRSGVPLFFAGILGQDTANIQVESIATAAPPTGGASSRFLIDDEMIDSDVPSIEALANRLKIDKDKLISDQNGDWFIDLPANEELWVPTGQLGDEGLFDMSANDGTSRPQFPFGTDTHPSFLDFLNYNEDSSSWRYNLVPKSMLDPLRGVGRFNNSTQIKQLKNSPNTVHVSPVFKSDVSALDSVGSPTYQGVNALGLRRGLLAFRIIDSRNSPSGGSYLPELKIKVVDPKTVDLNKVTPSWDQSSGALAIRLVR
jgi:Flp pilus assembly protein TadG